MSQYYYLMAQLPALDGLSDGAPLPITEETFVENCGRFLDEASMALLRGLSLTPPREPEPTGSAVVDAWYRGERELRLALGRERASGLHKAFDAGGETLSAPAVQAARTAIELDDPLAAERFLQEYRLGYLDSLRPLDEYSLENICYYGIKLKLLQRMGRFDAQRGKEAYRHIYDSILYGDDRENEA